MYPVRSSLNAKQNTSLVGWKGAVILDWFWKPVAKSFSL